jgi:hypothetical protein
MSPYARHSLTCEDGADANRSKDDRETTGEVNASNQHQSLHPPSSRQYFRIPVSPQPATTIDSEHNSSDRPGTTGLGDPLIQTEARVSASEERPPTRGPTDAATRHDDEQSASHGTLMLEKDGRSQYLGPTAGSEWLKDVRRTILLVHKLNLVSPRCMTLSRPLRKRTVQPLRRPRGTVSTKAPILSL